MRNGAIDDVSMPPTELIRSLTSAFERPGTTWTITDSSSGGAGAGSVAGGSVDGGDVWSFDGSGAGGVVGSGAGSSAGVSPSAGVDGSDAGGSSANAVGAVGAKRSAVNTPIAIGVRIRFEKLVGREAVHEVPADASENPTPPIPLVLSLAKPNASAPNP
jgi:hypothetical protein